MLLKVLREYNIHFTLHSDDEVRYVDSYEWKYRNLMILIRDKIYPEYFGECGGQGRCGTCVIEIHDPVFTSELSLRNEKSTLRKMGIIHLAVRLSCQIIVTPLLSGKQFKILSTI